MDMEEDVRGKDAQILNHGLEGRTKVLRFLPCTCMSEEGMMSPVGLMLAMNEEAENHFWNNPTFFAQYSRPDTTSGYFDLGLSMRITKDFHDFLRQGNIMGTNTFASDKLTPFAQILEIQEIKLPLDYQLDITYIGEKIYNTRRTFTTSCGKLLAEINIICGNANLETRKLHPLSQAALNNIRYLTTNNFKPQKIIILEEPMNDDDGDNLRKSSSNVKKYSFHNTVCNWNLDRNNHANYSYYIDLALLVFKNIILGEHAKDNKLDSLELSDFQIMFKNETLLGERVKCTSWSTGSGQKRNYKLYCRQEKDDGRLLAFVMAEMHNSYLHEKAKL